jgi:hypothetical protein
MKSHILKTCLLLALSPVALQAENLVVNGDFETGNGTAFWQAPGWYNCGTGLNQGTGARTDEGGVIITGIYSAVVNDRYVTDEAKFGSLAHAQTTKYIIQDGDSFSLSYEWRPADQWWQRSQDTIRFVLFATANDKLGGAKVWSSELTSDFFKDKPSGVMAVSATSSVVDPEAVGRVLFVMFYGVDTVNGGKDNTPHWAVVDNIEVKAVNEKPAP